MVEKRPEDAMSHDHQAHHQGAGNDEHADHDAHAGHDMADQAAHPGHDMADHAAHPGHDMADHAAHAGHDMADHDAHARHEMANHAAHGHEMANHDAHARHEMADHDAHAGHDKHAGHSVAMFRDKFWLSVVLTIPVLVWSEMIQEWLGYTAPSFALSDRIPAILGTIVFLYGGLPFLTGGLAELRDRQPGMMLLISLAIVVAFVASLASEFAWLDLEFWWELALLIDVMLLGHWQEMRALGQTSSALEGLAALLPDEAELVEGSEIRTVPAADLRPGHLVLVRPGGRVPADGTVVEGDAAMDESMITGESRTVHRRAGDRVVAGTVATDGSLRIRVEAVGEDTALAGIRRLVEQAQASNSRAQALADRAAAVLFFIAVAAGALTFIVWTAIGETGEAVERTVTVLVISCPHALGLAIPLVIAISTGIAARAGILIRDRIALERMRTVGAVLFDKTGTLTKGRPAVRDVAGDLPSDEVLRLAAAVEASSEHPLAKAVVTAAHDAPIASDFRALPGRGVEAVVDGHRVRVGGPALLRALGIDEPADIGREAAAWRARGATVLSVVRDDAVVGAIAVEDEIRPESVEAVRELHEEGVRIVMITGDAQEVAEAVACEVGVDEVKAEVLPEDKAGAVTELQQRGLQVAMVGDGVNDAPALAGADVGIAIGAGTDVAIESAGVVLASDDPRAVVSVRTLSKASYRKMVENLGWAVGYNVVAIPLAAGVFAWAGVVLAPAVGALAMSLSTIVVALNAMLLRRLDLRPGRVEGAPAPDHEHELAHQH
jgi:P-type Cu2+ transporter